MRLRITKSWYMCPVTVGDDVHRTVLFGGPNWWNARIVDEDEQFVRVRLFHVTEDGREEESKFTISDGREVSGVVELLRDAIEIED